ncbi:MAG: hypothetical protein AAB415_03100 [Patescibacteria group bacterium]
MNNWSPIFKIIFLGLILSLGISYALAVWDQPNFGPPSCGNDAQDPGCNPPINVGSAGQTKVGSLILETGAFVRGNLIFDNLMPTFDPLTGNFVPGGIDCGNGQILSRTSAGFGGWLCVDYNPNNLWKRSDAQFNDIENINIGNVLLATSTGFVGIGVTNPTSQLQISGNFALPVTNTTGTQGVIMLGGGGVRFLHNHDVNLFLGQNAGNFTSSGAISNTGIGNNTMFDLTAGSFNVAVGDNALTNITSSSYNIAVGSSALGNLTSSTGLYNTAVGDSALSTLISGSDNTAVGRKALFGNTASYNTALGGGAGIGNTSSPNNTFIGYNSGLNNTTSLGNNTFIGYNTGLSSVTQKTNATAIGANATVNADNALVLGDNSATGITNVGIGLNNPTAAKLTVRSSGAGDILRLERNVGGAGILALRVTNTDSVVMGNIAAPTAKLTVRGLGADILKLENNAGTAALTVNNAGSVAIGSGAPLTIAESLMVNGRIYTNGVMTFHGGGSLASPPVICDNANIASRGTLWYLENAVSKDSVMVCAKDASFNYAWRTLY